MTLSSDAMKSGRMLAEVHKSEGIRSFDLLVVPQNSSPPSLFVQGVDNANLDQLFSGSTPISVDDLEELSDAGLIEFRAKKQHEYSTIYRVRLKPDLLHAVESDFDDPAQGPLIPLIQISHANIIVERAEIADLVGHPNKLADAIMDRLLPELSKQDAFSDMQLADIRTTVEALREAVLEPEIEKAARRMWEDLGRTANFLTILQMLASAATVLAR